MIRRIAFYFVLIVAALCGGKPARAEDSAGPPKFTGEWRLDPGQSDMPQQRPGGGGWKGHGGRHGGGGGEGGSGEIESNGGGIRCPARPTATITVTPPGSS